MSRLGKRIERIAAFTTADLTYESVGGTRNAPMPSGYTHISRDVVLGSGSIAFHNAVEGLMRWDMHRRAGLTVTSSTTVATPGSVVLVQAGWGPICLDFPCKVTYVVNLENRQGFAYGTLAGHPEEGEELFLVTLNEGGIVRFSIRAFSRPATLLSRAGGPVARAMQKYATDRYVKAMDSLAKGRK